MSLCPCCSKKQFNECCEPIINGKAVAQTPEQLMRSRYTAYAKGYISYIIESTHPESRKTIDVESITQWSAQSEWIGLEIIKTQDKPEQHIVEFIAKYNQNGRDIQHHEIAYFKKQKNSWFYYKGHTPGIKTVRNQEPKTGRNDSCPCGSGKKFKKCCG